MLSKMTIVTVKAKTEKVDGLDYRQKSCELARKKENRRHGKYFLKIYLETIPPEEEGVLKKNS